SQEAKVIRKLVLDDYRFFTYNEIDAMVDRTARGLFALGVRPKQNVLIFAETRLEWMVTCQALFRLGATVVTLYATLGREGLVHGMNETQVTHVVTSADLLSKLAEVADSVPLVRCVVFIEGYRK